MFKRILIAILCVLCLGLSIFFLSKTNIVKNAFIASGIPDVFDIQIAQDAVKEIFSTPLRYAGDYFNGTLSADLVIESTNRERTKAGLPILSYNQSLALAASRKIDSMFSEQYFEHVSLSGKDVGDLATESGYAFIVVGENLALGNFKNDDALVKAWMDSPGHRANILNGKFSDIGVAVKKGTFEGRTTWLAVQEFGRPQSSCPSADTSLKISIEGRKLALDREYAYIVSLRDSISTSQPKNAKEQSIRNQNIDIYNSRVESYKTQSAILARDVDKYNEAVRNFNNCIR